MTEFGLEPSERDGWRVVVAPEGFQLWKGMPQTTLLIRDPKNRHAQDVAWFSTRPVAEMYAAERTTPQKRALAYEFSALRPLWLIDLLNPENLARILDSKKTKTAPGGGEEADIFRATTGFRISLEEQVSILRKHRGDKAVGVRPDARVGRASVSTYLDRVMANVLCRAVPSWVDGYYASATEAWVFPEAYPTQFLHEEICLCRSLHKIERSVLGVVPDYVGCQGAVSVKDGVVRKYSLSLEGIEREWHASEALRRLPAPPGMFALWDSREEKDGVVILSRSPPMPHDGWDYLLQCPSRDVMPWVARAEATLDFLKRARILHWDTRLANWLVTPEGHPLLSDFGTMRWIDEPAAPAVARRNFAEDVDLKALYIWLLAVALHRRHGPLLAHLKARVPFATLPRAVLRAADVSRILEGMLSPEFKAWQRAYFRTS